MRKNNKLVVILALTAAMLLAGCGSSKSEDYAYAPAAAEKSYMGGNGEDFMSMEAEEAAYDSDDLYDTASAEQSAEMPAETNESMEATSSSRKLIKTVNLSAQTKEFDKMIGTITGRIEALGGYAESMEISGNDYNASYSSTRYANIVARIPTAKLDDFVNYVADNSNITSKHESTEDVTLEYTDVEAHRNSLRIEQERLNELLEDADSLETVIALEERLAEVRYELESYESRMRMIDNKVDYSTVYLYIDEVRDYTPVPEMQKSFGQRIAEGFQSGLAEAKEGLQDFLVDFVTFLPELIVALLIIAIFVFIIVMIVKGFIALARKSSAKRAIKKAEKTRANVQVANTESNVKSTEESQNQETEDNGTK